MSVDPQDQSGPFAPTDPLQTVNEVVFDSEVSMVGGTDTASHYSLTGVVYITFPYLPNTPSTSRILSDVTLMFEGKSEYWDAEGRYTPMRLYWKRYNLLPHPYQIPGHLENDNHFSNVRIALDFDISIPGWLPPTHITDCTGTGYGLVARTTVEWEPECMGCLAYNVRPANYVPDMRVTTFSPYHPVLVRRHCLPAAVSGHEENPLHTRLFKIPRLGVIVDVTTREWYCLDPAERIDIRLDLRSIAKKPLDAWEPATKPFTVNLGSAAKSNGEGSAVHSLQRLLSRKEEVPIQLVEMGMHIDERTLVGSTPSRTYLSSFHIPTQPSDGHPLLGPSFCPRDMSQSQSQASTKPAHMSFEKACSLGPNGSQMCRRFSYNEMPVGRQWSTVMANLYPGHHSYRPQSDMDAAFIEIYHVLQLRLVFALANGTFETEWLSVPIRLGTVPRNNGQPSRAPPPYVSVFYDNREERDCEPLPMYSSASADQLLQRSPISIADYNTSGFRPRPPVQSEDQEELLGYDVNIIPEEQGAELDIHVEDEQSSNVDTSDSSQDLFEPSPSDHEAEDPTQRVSDSAEFSCPTSSSSLESESLSSLPARHRSAAAGMPFKSREVFEQWARETASSPALS